MITPLRVSLMFAGLLLAGCAQAPKTLYHWDGYQGQLYQYFKSGEGTDPQAQLTALQAQAQKAQAEAAVLPPGFRAHVGLLYLQLGNLDQARIRFEEEKAVFPESAPYMDFLLKKMTSAKASANPSGVKSK